MIFARVAIATCACLVVAACASTNNDDLAAVAENPSTTAVEVESVDTSETPESTDELGEGEPDGAAATTTVAPTTEAPPEQVAEDPSDDEAVADEATETEPAQEAAPESSTTEAPTSTTSAAPITTAPPATEAPTTTAAAEPAPNPDSPLNGTFATVGGQSIDLATLQGQDVVLWFWAPW